ncbi:MAG: 30S ribosomal protein S12 methylthiotransferase RimO [Planctomycetes bacterium]|nr:30S ribosomal protein S12 methylthiotransferase RimO [Planctomycetota bacterium]
MSVDQSHSTAGDSEHGDGEIRTVSLVSLGCPKNLVDSEKMLGLLAQDGLRPISYDPGSPGAAGESDLDQRDRTDHGIDPADAVVVNTCGFLEASKDESLAVIREAVRLKHAGVVKRVIVAGCLVQRHRARMLEWEPGIDAMVGVFDRDRIVEAVRGRMPTREGLDSADTPRYWIAASALHAAKDRGLKTAGLTVNGKDGKGIGYFEDDSARLRLTPRHYAYLRVSEGCNQNCSFCTIPSIRGKMRSKPIERIAAEAVELLNDGAFELSLIGQDTTSYGDDIGLGYDAGDPFAGGLPCMLRAVCRAVERDNSTGWVRLMYAYPSNFADGMIDALAELCRDGPLLPYIDIPLQHASDRMLKAMRRNVTAGRQEELIGTLRDRIPGMAVRTTFITGFPGETEDDHEQLLAFIERVRFDAVGVFEYSPEPGTPAGTMDRDPELAVPAKVKARRRGQIMRLQQRIAFEQASFLADAFDADRPTASGHQFDVLIDRAVGEDERLHVHQGRTYFQAPQIDAVTFVRSHERLSPGELVRCVVVGSDGYDLIAQPIADFDRRTRLPIL